MVRGANNRAAIASLVLAAAAAVAATALPLCAQVATDMTAGGMMAATEFVRVHCELSPYQVLLAWLPVAIGGMVVAVGTTSVAGITRTVAATLQLGFVFVAGFSIGLLYAPAAAAMIVAATTGEAGRRSTPATPAAQRFS